MDELEKSFKESMRPYWEKRLNDYPSNISKKLNRYYKYCQKIWRDDDKFKRQLFALSGGTLTIFASLGVGNSSPLTVFGFFLIGLSMVCTLISNLFSPQTLIFSEAKMEKDSIKFDEKDLDDIIGNIDPSKNSALISIAKGSLDHYKNQLSFDIKKHHKISESLEPILRSLRLDVQIISDMQKYLFLLGVLLISFGLLFSLLLKPESVEERLRYLIWFQ